MRLKEGVTISGIRPELVMACMIVKPIIESHDVEFVVTSCGDGEHSPKSLHYHGRAIDIRTRDLGFQMDESAAVLANEMRLALGAEFDVVVEATHIHVEFDPSR